MGTGNGPGDIAACLVVPCGCHQRHPVCGGRAEAQPGPQPWAHGVTGGVAFELGGTPASDRWGQDQRLAGATARFLGRRARRPSHAGLVAQTGPCSGGRPRVLGVVSSPGTGARPAAARWPAGHELSRKVTRTLAVVLGVLLPRLVTTQGRPHGVRAQLDARPGDGAGLWAVAPHRVAH